MGKKLKIGWFSFTCCEDSTVVFVEMLNEHFADWQEKIEFRHAKFLKSRNELDGLDVAFVEGAISSQKDADSVKKIRENCTKLVAIGSCACTGMPAAQRNLFDDKARASITPFLEKFGQLEKVVPLKDVVKVDAEVTGCPMDEPKFLDLLDACFKEFGVLNEADQ